MQKILVISLLNDYCSQLEHTLALEDLSQDLDSEMFIKKQLTRLETYIQTNREEIWGNLLHNKDAQSLFQRIHQLDSKKCKISLLANQLKNIQGTCAFLDLKVLLEEKDVTKIADWVIRNKEGINSNSNIQPLEVFENLSKGRDLLLQADLLTPDVGSALSHLITCGLGLEDQRDANDVKMQLTEFFDDDAELTLKALAHWINAKKIPLKNADLSLNELEAIAPYLHYVDCRELDLDNPEKFISSCSNAYHLFIKNDKLKELKQLPLQLQTLHCSGCPLTALDVSKNLQLQNLDCLECPITTLDVSKNLNLQTLYLSACPITALDVSKNLQLQRLYLSACPITALDVSNNLQLEKLDCSACPLTALDLSKNLKLKELNCSWCSLTALDVSKNLKLQNLFCSECPLTTLNLSSNPQLQRLFCNKCPNLTSLGDFLSNTLSELNCSECPNLAQLPQVPATTVVRSYDSPCGNLTSFKVNPNDIEKQPLQVLRQLGEHLLQNRPFPNVVYLDPITNKPSQGLDAGGLRRQLIATLCENLFKDNSGFSFTKETLGTTVPVLDNLNNDSTVKALRTFARIMALSATSDLLMGTNIDPHFFHGIFSLSDQDLKKPYDANTKKTIYCRYHALKELAKEDLAEIEKETPLINAIAIVANELKTVLGNRFGQWRNDIFGFIEKVQGKPVEAEDLKANILCRRADYKQWIDEFIDDLAKDPLIVEKDNIKTVYGLKEFLMLTTGAYSLGTHPIEIEVNPSRKYLESSIIFHTCFNTIEMPGDLTKESLKKELRECLLLAKGFNAA